jgi:fatty acid amide hydrolase
MAMDTPLTWSAATILRRIATGAISASELVNAYISRIETVNPRLNALVVPMFDSARAAAAAVDAARARGKVLGALAGLPFTVKESFDVAGTPTTLGLQSRLQHRAAADAFYVARMRQAGAILLGKTNVSQLLMSNESQNPAYGRTRNPWNRDRSAGGSSGGEAALIAAGGSVLGLGSDIGGSIRLPAHACGIHGIKPTSGRLTMAGHAVLFAGQEAILAQPGPLARNVADLELAMQFLSADDNVAAQPGLEESMPPVKLPPSASVRLDQLRVAMYTQNGVMMVAPGLRRAVLEAASALRDRGCAVEEWQPPEISEAWRIYTGMCGPLDPPIRPMFFAGLFPLRVVSGISRSFGIPSQKDLPTADEYLKLVEAGKFYQERFLRELVRGRFDAVICPPDALPAIRHGSGQHLADALSHAALYNLLGMPAGVVAATRVRPGEEEGPADKESRDLVERAALRTERGSTGLPVGVQVAAWHWREDIVLRIMSVLEEHFKRIPGYPGAPPI